MADNTTATSFQAAAYTSQGTARDKVALPGDAVRRHREHAGDAPGGEGVPRQPAPGQRGDEDPQVRDGRQSEAVEAEGHGPRSRRFDPRAALGGRRHGLRTDSAQLRAVRAAPGARARAQERAQRARPRERDLRDRRFDYDAPKTSRLSALVARLGVADKKVLILTDGAKPNVFLSGRNLRPCTSCRTATCRPTTSCGRTSC